MLDNAAASHFKAELKEAKEAERGRKATETELTEVSERADMLRTENTALINYKRKLEGEVEKYQNAAEEKAKQQAMMVDVSQTDLWFALLVI